MDNLEAYAFLKENNTESLSSLTRKFISQCTVKDEYFDHYRLKFVALLKEREVNRKRQKLEAWNVEIFGPTLEQIIISSHPKEKNSSRLKPLLECTLKHQRNRMTNLLNTVREFAEYEEISPKQVAALLLMMISNDEKDYTVSNICKEVVATGTFGSTKYELKPPSCSFLLDFLSLGRRKYAELRRFMKLESITLTSYTKLSHFRSQVNLLNELKFVTSSLNHPVGITIPYRDILATTVHQLMEIDENLQNASYPINVTVVDGLDGSGSHRLYNQLQDHPDISTKSFLLFCFRIVCIKDSSNMIIWKNPIPNSPFAVRPLSLFAVPENENNVRFLMESINVETEYIQSHGFQLPQGKCDVRIERAMFDTKMAGILDGAGGAACHLCTATREQLTERFLIQQGFPINRTIQQARDIFLEVDEAEFLSRAPSARFNITHQPISAIDIIPASPLHGYIRIFSWLMNLSYHIHAGVTKWSPSSPIIEKSKVFVRNFMQEKTGIRIDFPNSQGGTSTTGNVARLCFSKACEEPNSYLRWILTLLPSTCRDSFTTIHSNLGVILRIFNSDKLVNEETFERICKDTYVYILDNYPWANVTPTLHKVLGHSMELMTRYNEGRGMKSFSEEGLDRVISILGDTVRC